MRGNSISGARPRSLETVCVCAVGRLDNAGVHAVRDVLGITVGARGLKTVFNTSGNVVVETCSHPVGPVDAAS